MKGTIEKISLLSVVVTLALTMNFLFRSFTKVCLAGDEAIFIRITNSLPEYRSYPQWYTRSGVVDPDEWGILPASPFYWKAYNDPIWHHPPLANYLAYPAVKLFWNEEGLEGQERIDAIDTGTKNLRRVA